METASFFSLKQEKSYMIQEYANYLRDGAEGTGVREDCAEVRKPACPQPWCKETHKGGDSEN